MRGNGVASLWFGILGPPLFWAARLSSSYALVPFACRTGWVGLLNLVTGAALLGALVAGAVAWKRWRDVGGGTEVDADGRAARTRFMGLVGVLSSGFFFLVILAEGIGNFLIDPCAGGGAPL